MKMQSLILVIILSVALPVMAQQLSTPTFDEIQRQAQQARQVKLEPAELTSLKDLQGERDRLSQGAAAASKELDAQCGVNTICAPDLAEALIGKAESVAQDYYRAELKLVDALMTSVRTDKERHGRSVRAREERQKELAAQQGVVDRQREDVAKQKQQLETEMKSTLVSALPDSEKARRLMLLERRLSLADRKEQAVAGRKQILEKARWQGEPATIRLEIQGLELEEEEQYLENLRLDLDSETWLAQEVFGARRAELELQRAALEVQNRREMLGGNRQSVFSLSATTAVPSLEPADAAEVQGKLRQLQTCAASGKQTVSDCYRGIFVSKR